MFFFLLFTAVTKKIIWQLWDSNPRPFGLVPKTSALDHSAKLPYDKFSLEANNIFFSDNYFLPLNSGQFGNKSNIGPKHATFQTLGQSYPASLAQWQSTGLVNQGSWVQISQEAFFVCFPSFALKKKGWFVSNILKVNSITPQNHSQFIIGQFGRVV